MHLVNDDRLDNFKRNAFKLIAAVSILGFILAGLSVATNPDHIMPLVPEILSLSFFLILASVTGGIEFSGLNKVEKRAMKVYMALVVILGIIALFSVRKSLCWKAGSNLYRLECVLQSTVLLPHALRQFSTFFICSLLFCLSYLLPARSRFIDVNSNSFPFWSLGAVLLGETYYVLSDTRLSPSWLGVAEDQFARTGLSGVFTNVSWAWPYLIPSLILSLVLLDVAQKRYRLFGYCTFILLLGTLALNRQRGFILSTAVLVLTFGLFKIVQGVEIGSRRRKIAGTISILSVGFAVLFFHFFAEKVSFFFRYFGYAQNLKTPLSASSQRLELWKFAFEKIVENPFGYGYSSWFSVNQLGFQEKKIGVLFENPHNAFVEILVEFGVIPAILLLTALVYLMLLGWRRPLERWKRCLWVYFWVGLLSVIIVQEINYVRTTFLIWAVFAGSVFRIVLRNSTSTPYYDSFEKPKLDRTVFCAGGIALFFALSLTYLLSFGAYGFEPSSRPYEVERWIGPDATVKSTPSSKGGYVLFPMNIGPVGPEQVVAFDGIRILRPSPKNWFIPVPRNQYFIGTKSISFGSSYIDYTRHISAKIMYPPVTFAVPILWNEGFHFLNSNKISCSLKKCRLLLINEDRVGSMLNSLIESRKSSFTWYSSTQYLLDLKLGNIDLEN